MILVQWILWLWILASGFNLLKAQTKESTYEYRLALKNKRSFQGYLESNAVLRVLNADSSTKIEYTLGDIEYFYFNKNSIIGRYIAMEASIQTYAFTGSGEHVDLSASGINIGLKYMYQFSNTWGVSTGFVWEYYNRNFFGNWEEISQPWQTIRTITNEGEMYIFNVPLHFTLFTGEFLNPNFYLHLGSDIGIFHFRKRIVRVDDSNNFWESINVRRTGLNIHFFDLGIGARIPFNRSYAILLNNRTALGLLSYPGGIGISIQSGFCISLITRLKNLSYP
ncbi:MAG: hypothetical protein RML72_08290 [Bacteroidia bacterium]|nr:hypothetical protein [Bacteroidia bacterium]